MRISAALLHVTATVALSAAASAQGTSTIWNHNGSEVSLSANGNQREFRYRTPRPGLLEVGVQQGTLLFQGTKIDNQYSGTAFLFSKSCGPLPYAVTGPVSPDQRTVTFYGKAPDQMNSNCQVLDYRDDTLVFEFLPNMKVAAQQSDETQEYGTDGRLFSSGADDYYLLSRKAEGNEDSTGYVGQVRVVHHYQGAGYQILMKDYSARCRAADNTLSVIWFKAGDQSNPYMVRIDHPDRSPASDQKESYNLYWAACYGKFAKFR